METAAMNQNHPAYRKVLVVIVAIVALVMLVIVVDWIFRAATFPVNEIQLQGEFNRVSRVDIERKLYNHVLDNYLMLNLDAIRTDIESLPWVFRASVTRRWPSGLHIEYREQHLMAHWQENKWLNHQGDVVALDRDYVPEPAFPRLDGPAGTANLVHAAYTRFRDMLAVAGLQMQAVSLSDRRSWSIRLQDGTELLLGRNEIAERLQRFIDVYPDLKQVHEGRLVRVDLRYTNGFSVAGSKDAETVTGTDAGRMKG
ncbi:MAG: cell division protein FtsQ/DivIB [Gammaproteobacteria bacterium]|nr:cell division protein FtsQ/DivIB [Gammaproteobacteria bacterium]